MIYLNEQKSLNDILFECISILAWVLIIIVEHRGLIVWFIILISAKLSHISRGKKLTNWQLLSNILYCIVGGVMAYYGTSSFSKDNRILATAIGVLAGDVMVGYIIENAPGFVKETGKSLTRYLRKHGK